MGRALLSFLATIGLIIPISMSPGPAMGQDGGNGPDRGFGNNDCRGDLESSLHTGDGATGNNGGGNNNDRGRQFPVDEDGLQLVVAGSPNNPHLVFGNNNGACVTFEN